MDVLVVSKWLLFKRRKSDLPVYEERRFNKRHEITFAGSQLEKKLVHLIPVAILLCIFTLWWFSYPVNLEIKDGRIAAVHKFVTVEDMEDDVPAVHLTSLASISLSSSQVQIAKNSSIGEQSSTKEDRG